MLKNSARNWAPYRSLNVKFLKIEKSMFLKPESRKMFRPMLPNVPSAGGVRNALPVGETKQPAAVRVLISLACVVQDFQSAPELANGALSTKVMSLVVVQAPPVPSASPVQ